MAHMSADDWMIILPCSVQLLSGVKSCQAAAVMRADEDAGKKCVCMNSCVSGSVCVCVCVWEGVYILAASKQQPVLRLSQMKAHTFNPRRR